MEIYGTRSAKIDLQVEPCTQPLLAAWLGNLPHPPHAVPFYQGVGCQRPLAALSVAVGCGAEAVPEMQRPSLAMMAVATIVASLRVLALPASPVLGLTGLETTV